MKKLTTLLAALFKVHNIQAESPQKNQLSGSNPLYQSD